ncbi:MAG TPA: deoxyribodipyrimidine photo-lyase [Burkholderiaceae bacterium]|nr:deoxyribodipyrimidine photo-lyase [Burkholderiaceae bacterium]
MDAALVWFRRDLRSFDHAALSHALRAAGRVWCVFVFDREILDPLPRRDRRVEFIHQAIGELHAALVEAGGGLIVEHGRPQELIPRLAERLSVDRVVAARDYEPAACARDEAVCHSLQAQGRELLLVKDQAIFDTDELLTAGGTPYSVFTPYRRAWLARLQPEDLSPHRVVFGERLARAPRGVQLGVRFGVPTLESIGFERTDLAALKIPSGMSGGRRLFERFEQRIADYHERRDYPAARGTSGLSVHLRFGTVSIRQLARFAHQRAIGEPAAAQGAQTWLSELIWRDFYFQVLHHHPHVVDHAFKPAYDQVRWRHAPAAFDAWREGRTGYPLVDAAMLQLVTTGYMHNRLRMVSASFLTKDLGIRWQDGERHFALLLNDYDLAANNGGWQWAASTGCDAQPWFRIFNPVTQSKKFDPQGAFIRRHLPVLARLPDTTIHAPWLASPQQLADAGVKLGENYPAPIVDHDEARKQALERYGVVGR